MCVCVFIIIGSWRALGGNFEVILEAVRDGLYNSHSSFRSGFPVPWERAPRCNSRYLISRCMNHWIVCMIIWDWLTMAPTVKVYKWIFVITGDGAASYVVVLRRPRMSLITFHLDDRPICWWWTWSLFTWLRIHSIHLIVTEDIWIWVSSVLFLMVPFASKSNCVALMMGFVRGASGVPSVWIAPQMISCIKCNVFW